MRATAKQAAKKRLLAFLAAQHAAHGNSDLTPCVELWPRSEIRVAEVGYTFGEQGQSGSGGAVFMQVDVPHGACACLLTERVLIAYAEDWPASDIEEEEQRLVYAIWNSD